MKRTHITLALAGITALTSFALIFPTALAETNNAQYHTVQKGETLYGIATKYNLSVSELKGLNNLTLDTIQPNQSLLVATNTNESASETVNYATDGSYIVKSGDTLYDLARANGVTVAQLKAWNNLTSDLLRIGQKLVFSGTNTPTTPTQPSASTNYTVKSGDTLYDLARANGVSVAQLKAWNNLTSDLLRIGQKLVLSGTSAPDNPTQPTTTTNYTVKSGDTLYDLARANGVSVAQLKAWNNLTSDLLRIGQKLVFSGTNTPTTPTQPSASTNYTVKSGDTLYDLARANGVSVAQLKAWNNLTSDLIRIGQKLVLSGTSTPATPQQPAGSANYTVKSGDTLYDLARANGVSVAQLKAWNNLTSDLLRIGQKLVVVPATAEYYTVKSGDSFYKIALEFNTTVVKLRQLNHTSSDKLYIGQVIRVK